MKASDKRRGSVRLGVECSVEHASAGFVVKTAKGIAATFIDPVPACLVAAILPQTGRGLLYRSVERGDGGFDVVRGDTHVVGWLRQYNPELIEALHVLAGILSSPSALSWLLEAIRFRASLAGKP